MLTEYETQVLQSKATANVRSLDVPARAAAERKSVAADRPYLESVALGADRERSPLHLTPRQLEVLSLLCRGYSNKLICRHLNICAGTVKVHIACILRALGAANRLQAVVQAHRYGLTGELLCHAVAEAHAGNDRSALAAETGALQFMRTARRCTLRAA